MEETFVNAGARSTLLLGQARGIALMTPASMGLPVGEYAANLVKKSVVGTGHAEKKQIELMVKTLMPAANFKSPMRRTRWPSPFATRIIGNASKLVERA